MAYTDDAVKAKLSALNETQEGIVTVAQWIMFHRRHADRTAHLWMSRLKESSPGKKLNLVYLANEVVQQSKARKKTEFVNAFSPIIADGTAIAYRGSTHDVQQKIRRVIEVWRQRQIFDQPVQEAVEAKVDEVDRSRGAGKKPALGGSLFSSSGPSAPPELQPLIALQSNVTKAEVTSKPAITAANEEYEKLTDPANPVPTPPLHAAKLSSLLKSLANAEGAVAEGIKARRALIEGLEKILDTNRSALADEETQHFELVTRKTSIEVKKREVEDGIMRGLSAEPSAAPSHSPEADEVTRPDMEELTPPPVEALTPVGSPQRAPAYTDTTGADVIEELPVSHNEPDPDPAFLATAPLYYRNQPEPSLAQQQYQHNQQAGADLLSSLTTARPSQPTRERSEDGVNGGYGTYGGSIKRRRMGSGAQTDEFAEFAQGEGMDGLDADVAEMLAAE